MILHYTKHANDKFFMLQRHGRQVFKDDINGIIKFPDSVEQKKDLYFANGKLSSEDEFWQVIYQKDSTIVKILTFYPLSKD